MLYFATYFDSNYLNRGIVLFNSLSKHSSSPIWLFVLALDNKTVEYYTQHPDERITVIPLSVLENHFPELISVKNNRSLVEYYFTLSPYLPLYILDVYKNIERITTLDADICFYSDPAVIFNQYAHASILITPHRFSKALSSLEKYGLYNVSFQSFKNDSCARACLEDWKEKCTNWCYDFWDENQQRFADQKYLDAWTKQFTNVGVIEMPEAGLAPWNIDNYKLEIKNDNFYVDGTPLIFFHFHGLRILTPYLALSNLHMYKTKADLTVKKIYHGYLKKLIAASKENITDSKVQRMHNIMHKPLFKILLEVNDFFYFNSYYIVNIKLRPLYLKYLSMKNKLNGRTNKPRNLY